MHQKAVIKLCKELGCCDTCCLRFLGLKNANIYEKPSKYILTHQDETVIDSTDEQTNGQNHEATDNGTPAKKRRLDIVCTSCLGVLQENTWPQCFDMVKEMMEKKKYACSTFACALSAPIATLLREKAITLQLLHAFSDYDPKCVTPLKEAWKWTFGYGLASHINMALDSGAVSPLLITLCLEYPDDLQELEILKTLSSSLFETRSKQKRRFTVEFTRRSVEQALDGVTLEALKKCEEWKDGMKIANVGVKCVSAVGARTPLYLGGRYIKLSRNLPQTPWIVNGKLMMHSSVQDILFAPIANIYGMCPSEMEHRLKLISAGREDVDVRCLGDGRPFAIEISDPRRELTEAELQQICEEASSDGKIVVKKLVHIDKDDLTQLKKGEETKSKTYKALCIKLSHSKYDDMDPTSPVTVTEADITRISMYRNTPEGDPARITLTQKTPIRVLHRRPLLVRTRKILDLSAKTVPGHPQLMTVTVSTEAGTYVKEWAHGELGRTIPSLANILAADLDILALDVVSVNLDWPIIHQT